MSNKTFKALRVTEDETGKFVRNIIERKIDDLPDGDVLIRVHYAALNYKDALSSTGNKGVTRNYPHTPGIDGAGIRPGFIKISVNPESLSDLHRKLVEAAAITHLHTGLTITSHTGPSGPAFEQLDILQKLGVHASAFVWVHAQNEKDKTAYFNAIRKGAWISLDGVQESNMHEYVEVLQMIKKRGFLDQILISQDAGWYEPGKPWNGPVRDYTVIFKQLIPKLKISGFNQKNIKQLFEINPQKAFTIKVRNL